MCSDDATRAFRRSADTGMGFTGLALARCWLRDGTARSRRPTAPAPGPEGQSRHLDLPLRRRQPRRELRSQAGAESLRRQVDRDHAVQGRAQPGAAQGHRLGQPDARRSQDPDGPEHRLPQVRPVRAGGRRLVATRRLVCRRHRGRSLALDDRQRPRRAAPVPHRPARARGGPSRRSARGSPTAWARSTKTCRSTSCWASRPAIAAAARGLTARPTSGRSTPGSGSIPMPRSRCRSSRRDSG